MIFIMIEPEIQQHKDIKMIDIMIYIYIILYLYSYMDKMTEKTIGRSVDR